MALLCGNCGKPFVASGAGHIWCKPCTVRFEEREEELKQKTAAERRKAVSANHERFQEWRQR